MYPKCKTLSVLHNNAETWPWEEYMLIYMTVCLTLPFFKKEGVTFIIFSCVIKSQKSRAVTFIHVFMKRE